MHDTELADEIESGAATNRRPFMVLGLLALVWLAALVTAQLPNSLTAFAQLVLPYFPPLAIITLLFAFLPRFQRTSDIDALELRLSKATHATNELGNELFRIDALLGDSLDKIDQLRVASAPHGEGLLATAGQLEVAAGTMALATADMQKAASSLLDQAPDLNQQTQQTEAVLKITASEARRHLEAVEAIMAQVAAHGRDAGHEAEAMIDTLQKLLTQIDQTSSETTKSIASRAYTLDAAVTGVLDRSAEAFANIGHTLSEQAQSVEKMVTQSQQELLAVSTDSTRAIAARIDELLAAATTLRQHFDEQLTLSTQVHGNSLQGIANVQERLDLLTEHQQSSARNLLLETDQQAQAFEDRLQALALRQQQALDELRQHHVETTLLLHTTDEQVQELGNTIEQRYGRVTALEEHITRLSPLLSELAAEADNRLPVMESGLIKVAQQGLNLTTQLDTLSERIENQTRLLHDTSTAFEQDHQAVTSLSEKLSMEFDKVRIAVREIQEATEQTSVTSAARMVENVQHVRQAVGSTADELEKMIHTASQEAQATLLDLASNKATSAFTTPINQQLTVLEEASCKAADAAQSATDKLSVRLVELLRVVGETEARIDEADTRMQMRSRGTLAARSLRLVEKLQATAIDITRLLNIEVEADTWSRYLAGDRGLFTRNIVRLADKDTSRKIARHYEHDTEFEAEASQYLDQFETLIHRVLKDAEGEAFALILLSSDIGKLYVLIAEALGRPLNRKET